MKKSAFILLFMKGLLEWMIDLANVFSCSFIATQDLGTVNGEVFEIAGRYDLADIRGCNLLVQ